MSNLPASRPKSDLVVDDLFIQVRHSSRRATLGLTVERDGALVVTIPTDCPSERVEQFIRNKQPWIYARLTEKELLRRPAAREPEFVNGEGFYYLGRKYQLRLVSAESQPQPLRLKQGRFDLRRDALAGAHQHFIDWYMTHGQPWIKERIALYSGRLGVTPTAIVVRDLGYRWGSCSAGGALNFHWRAVCLPARIIEYIVVHELVHLREPHHGPEFWQRVKRAMPDYDERRQWLAEQGIHY